jgi:hypothetical protein
MKRFDYAFAWPIFSRKREDSLLSCKIRLLNLIFIKLLAKNPLYRSLF